MFSQGWNDWQITAREGAVLKRQRDESETEEGPSSEEQAGPESRDNCSGSTPRETFRRRRYLSVDEGLRQGKRACHTIVAGAPKAAS
jgi:hypothetical protein